MRCHAEFQWGREKGGKSAIGSSWDTGSPIGLYDRHDPDRAGRRGGRAEDKPEPPAKARTFKSNLPLSVLEWTNNGTLELRGGTSPLVKKGVSLPAETVWMVQPMGGGFGGGIAGFGGGVGGINLGGGANLGGVANLGGGGFIGGVDTRLYHPRAKANFLPPQSVLVPISGAKHSRA
jgi:hypothetical protein